MINILFWIILVGTIAGTSVYLIVDTVKQNRKIRNLIDARDRAFRRAGLPTDAEIGYDPRTGTFRK